MAVVLVVELEAEVFVGSAGSEEVIGPLTVVAGVVDVPVGSDGSDVPEASVGAAEVVEEGASDELGAGAADESVAGAAGVADAAVEGSVLAAGAVGAA